MKKSKIAVFLTLAAALLGTTTSCLKDGFNDFGGLGKPLYVDGHFNPELGVPVGHASITVEQLLQKFGDNLGDWLYTTEDSLVGIRFDTAMLFAIDLQGMNTPATGSKGAKSGDEADTTKTEGSYTGSLQNDAFENLFGMVDAEVMFRNLLADLSADLVLRNCDDEMIDNLNRAGIELNISNVHLWAEGRGGESQHVELHPGAPINIIAFVNEGHIDLLQGTDISTLINVKPNTFHYSVDYEIVIHNQQFAGFILSFEDHGQSFLNSINDVGVDLNMHFHITFPVSASISGFSVEKSMPMKPIDPKFDLKTFGELTIDTSAIYLELDNALPFALELSGALVDSTDGSSVPLFEDNATVSIPAAKVAPTGPNGTYQASEPSKAIVRIPLTEATLGMLPHCNKLSFNVAIASAESSEGHIVSIRTSDDLSMRVYVKAKANADINFHLLN